MYTESFIGFVDIRNGVYFPAVDLEPNSPYYYIPVRGDGKLFGFEDIKIVGSYVVVAEMKIAGCILYKTMNGCFIVGRHDKSFYVAKSLEVALTEIVSANKAVNFFYRNTSEGEIFFEVARVKTYYTSSDGYYLNKYIPSLGWDLMVKRSSRSLTFEELKALSNPSYNDISFMDNMF